MKELHTQIRDMLKSGAYGTSPPEDFAADRSLLNAGTIDSFGLFRFVRDIEKTFALKVLDKDIHPANFETIENIARFIESRKTPPA